MNDLSMLRTIYNLADDYGASAELSPYGLSLTIKCLDWSVRDVIPFKDLESNAEILTLVDDTLTSMTNKMENR